MARTGRNRKSGTRYPSGDIRQEPQESPHQIAMRQPHRRNVPLDHAHDQRGGWPLGCFNIWGAISGDEYRAGVRFARICARWKLVVDSQKSSPSSIAGAMEPKGSLPLITDADAEDWKDEYNVVMKALMDTAGRTSAIYVALMAVLEEPCPAGGFGAVIRGLGALREHFEARDKARNV